MKKILEKILKMLAIQILKKYNPKIIAITGSVGKTSTKEAVKTVLEKNFSVRASYKNYNNEIGVPLTIIGEKSPGRSAGGWLRVIQKGLRLIFLKNDYPRLLILELGVQKAGEMDYLLDFISPQVGILTDISGSHLEFFGSISKIEKEKRKLIEVVPKNGLVVLNYDNQIVKKAGEKAKAKVIGYGKGRGATIRIAEAGIVYEEKTILTKPFGMGFKLITEGNVVPILLPKVFSYKQIYSALAAFAVGRHYGLSILDIVQSLKSFSPPPGRMNLIKGIKHSWIIDDTYNSSPQSSRAALEVLDELKKEKTGKKIVVFGDMLEIGKETEKEHLSLGSKVAKSEADILITKGKLSKFIAEGARQSGMPKSHIFSFSHNKETGTFLQEIIKKGDIVLIKGSQGMKMEEIVKEVMAYPLRASQLLVRQED